MASLRKKYSTHFESAGKDGAPVTSPPKVTASELPPAVETKPPELIEPQSPVDAAASSAIKDRLAEMQRAEQLAKAPPPQPQRAAEPSQQQPEMPAAVAKWLAEHPEYTNPNDQIAQVEISLATMKAARDGLTWNDDDFLPSIERHLGIAPRTNGHVESRPTPQPANVSPANHSASQRQQVRPMAVPVSAPPTRQVPSMATGRAPSYRAPLNKDELEIAAACGQTPEQYAEQKVKWQRMKAEGAQ
jgi:hypothetical protein